MALASIPTYESTDCFFPLGQSRRNSSESEYSSYFSNFLKKPYIIRIQNKNRVDTSAFKQWLNATEFTFLSSFNHTSHKEINDTEYVLDLEEQSKILNKQYQTLYVKYLIKSNLLFDLNKKPESLLHYSVETGIVSDELLSVFEESIDVSTFYSFLLNIGDERDEKTHRHRINILLHYLKHRNPSLRDAAALGLVNLEDKEAYPYLENAIDVETIPELREDLIEALTELRSINARVLP